MFVSIFMFDFLIVYGLDVFFLFVFSFVYQIVVKTQNNRHNRIAEIIEHRKTEMGTYDIKMACMFLCFQ